MEALFQNFLASDPKVITAMLAIVGTVIAAVLSSAGYLYRVRTDQKKSLRKVLYLLLEIRHAVISRFFDPEALTKEYLTEATKRLTTRGIKSDTEEIPAVYRELISAHFNNVISCLRSQLDERLLVPFEEALLEMATVAPALAFKLRGREKLEAVIGHTNQYESQLSGKLEVDIPEPFRQIMLETSSGLKEETLEDIYETLNKDVMLLAKACGRRDRHACQKIINEGPSPKQHLDLDELDALIDSLISAIATVVNAGGVKDKPVSTVPNLQPNTAPRHS